MDRLLRPVVVPTILVTVIAACGSAAQSTTSAAPTSAPTTSPTEAPTIGATVVPPTVTPGPTLIPYPGPSIPPGTPTIKIATLTNVSEFDTAELAAPANKPFVIEFDNKDASYGAVHGTDPHNVAIRDGTSDSDPLIFNPLPAFPGPKVVDYYISGGLPAGSYRFLCIIHPFMTGILTVT